MVKMYLSVFAEHDRFRLPEIERDISPEDDRTLADYCKDVVCEVPKSMDEISPMAVLFGYLSNPLLRCFFAPADPDVEESTTLCNLAEKGRDVVVYALAREVDMQGAKRYETKRRVEETLEELFDVMLLQMKAYAGVQECRFLDSLEDEPEDEQVTGYHVDPGLA